MFRLRSAAMKTTQKCVAEFSKLSSKINVAQPKVIPIVPRPDDVLGQPTPESHPHLLKPGEVVPCVKVEELKQRRYNLMEAIRKHAYDKKIEAKSHTIVIPSAGKKYISEKIPYVFRQNSDFFYLTGCQEPDSVLMIHSDERGHTTSTLFMRPKDKHAELWDGPRTGIDSSLHLFGVDEAHEVMYFSSILEAKAEGKSNVMWYDSDRSEQRKVTTDINTIYPNRGFQSPNPIIQAMRLFKSPAEIELMRKTCRIASEAINETMAEAKSGQSEHHIFATVDYKCRMKNASHLAYPPVVAAGCNATTIHYVNNTQLIKNGELVLMDAGCEYGGYTSDITRTWPIDGQFTEPQRVLYEILLTLQKELIATLTREGGENLNNLFDTMCVKLGRYLQEVGVIYKNFTQDGTVARAAYDLCPHHVSHYLGMDVHDTPLISRNLRLQPGMVFTVEPGIYINSKKFEVPREFRGIGMRIEDDILITPENTVEVLTSSCVKERSALEKLIKKETV